MLLLMVSLLDDEQRDLFEKIFREDRSYFFRIAYRILASKEDAEDAVSEAMLRIVDNLKKISSLPRPKMRAYCIIIVKNCARAKLRRDAKLQFTDCPEQFSAGKEDDVESICFKKLDEEEIQTALSGLTEDEQRLIFLRYNNRMTYKEIAGVLLRPEENVRKQGARLIEKLRKQMGDVTD